MTALQILWLLVQLVFWCALIALTLAATAVATLAPPIAALVVAWRRIIRPRLFRAEVVVRTGEPGAG